MIFKHLAIDFGTTNSVIAGWNEKTQSAEVLSFPPLTDNSAITPPLIPSLLYINDGHNQTFTVGQAVRDQGLDQQNDNRLFRNFKRGIIATNSPMSRSIDGVLWNDHDAGRHFLQTLMDNLPIDPYQIEQLVLTAPVAAFQGYLQWLERALQHDSASSPSDNIRIVDESTAAALGYAVHESGALVLVVDFGGGTLDLSLVQLPESSDQIGGVLNRLLGGNANRKRASVIAKAGRNLGGSDIDQWLLAEILRRNHLSIDALGNGYAEMLTRCESAKIALSTTDAVTIHIEVAGRVIDTTITRDELEAILRQNGFFTILHRTVDKVMHTARQQGILREDIHSVLMVGGTSLMPAVQSTLSQYFDELPVKAHKPFTAVVEGALSVARGLGVQDYLVHGYGIRHLDPTTKTHQYDEIIPMGTPYPLDKPIEIVLGAAHQNQTEIELIIGEINTDAVSMIEVQYHDGQAVFVAQGSRTDSDILPLNLGEDVVCVPLNPVGIPSQDRIKAAFTINDCRELRVTVTDLAIKHTLLRDGLLTTIR